MTGKISFVIPNRGRELMLRQTIESIVAQQYEREKIEIIVVTQNESLESETEALIQAYGVTLLRAEESSNISEVRNQGALASSGDYLVFLDSDVHIEPNWIETMIGTLEKDPRRVIVSAVQACEDDAPVLEKIRTELSRAAVDCEVQFLPGANLFMLRETFDKAGGFPAHLITCEDYYFTQKVAEQGKLFYTSKSSFIHLGEDKTFDVMFRKEIWRGQSNLRSLGGRKIPLSEIPSFLVPVWFALFSAAFVLSLPFSNRFSSFILLLFALLPVALYSWRLYRHAEGRLPFMPVVRFYSLYFPARFWGTLVGVFKIFKS